MLVEGVLSDVTEKTTASTPATTGQGAITLVCGVFSRMLSESVDRAAVGLAGPTVRDLLYVQENWSTS